MLFWKVNNFSCVNTVLQCWNKIIFINVQLSQNIRFTALLLYVWKWLLNWKTWLKWIHSVILIKGLPWFVTIYFIFLHLILRPYSSYSWNVKIIGMWFPWTLIYPNGSNVIWSHDIILILDIVFVLTIMQCYFMSPCEVIWSFTFQPPLVIHKGKVVHQQIHITLEN